MSMDIGVASAKTTGVSRLDEALTNLAAAREAQWEAMRTFHESAGIMERAMTNLAKANEAVDLLHKAVCNHLEITTRPDGDEPPMLTQAGVAWAGEAVATAKGLFPSNATFVHNGKTMIRYGLSDQEILHTLAGNKIGAIKLVRERLGNGLKEAKDMVDLFYQNNRIGS